MKQPKPLTQILKTSLPAVIDLSSQTFMWTFEAILIGQLGVAAFAGVAMANQVMLVITTAVITFIFGASILISRHLGANEVDEANHILGQALLLGSVISIFIALVLYFGAPNLLKLIGAEGTDDLSRQIAQRSGMAYLKTIALFAPIVLTNFLAVGIIRGAGDTHFSMLINIIINGINFILAPVMIFGLLGFPRFEIFGAALAFGISHSIGFLVTLYLLRTRKTHLYLDFSEFFKPKAATFKRLFKLGLPTSVEQLTWAMGMLFVTSFAATAGVTVLATHQIFVKIQAILSMTYLAFSMGAMTLMGKNIGAAQNHLAEATAKTSKRVVIVWALVVTTVVILSRKSLISIFTSDPSVLQMGSVCMIMFAITQIPKAMNGVVIGNLRGCGELKWIMFSTMIGVFLFEIGLNWAFLSTLDNEIYLLFALWAVQGFDELMRYLMNSFRFKGGKWKLIDNL